MPSSYPIKSHCDDDKGGEATYMSLNEEKKKEEIFNNEFSILNIQLFFGLGYSTLDIGY